MLGCSVQEMFGRRKKNGGVIKELICSNKLRSCVNVDDVYRILGSTFCRRIFTGALKNDIF